NKLAFRRLLDAVGGPARSALAPKIVKTPDLTAEMRAIRGPAVDVSRDLDNVEESEGRDSLQEGGHLPVAFVRRDPLEGHPVAERALEQIERDLRLRPEDQILRDPDLVAASGILEPAFGDVEVTVDPRVEVRRHVDA